MKQAIAYIATLLTFGVLDAVWLTTMSSRLYRPALGDLLSPDLRIAPALVFYFLFPVGVVVFAVLPALKTGSAMAALGYAALFGLIAYGTYDLTNFATLRNWTAQITIIDLAYGTVATAVAAIVAFYVTRAFAS